MRIIIGIAIANEIRLERKCELDKQVKTRKQSYHNVRNKQRKKRKKKKKKVEFCLCQKRHIQGRLTEKYLKPIFIEL
jgi:hypothetical protein